jgi:hypothetical protein
MDCFTQSFGPSGQHYNENFDPSDLTLAFYSPAIPIDQYVHRLPIENRMKLVDYDHCLKPIVNLIASDTVFHDFPFSVTFYIGELGRQRIILNDVHTLIALYNHSDFLKMHFHNAWLLGKTELTIVLPEELFPNSNHLFTFCGSYSIISFCPDRDVSCFNFETFLFAAAYLMIHDDFLLSILHTLKLQTFDQNSSILLAYYMLNTMELNFPLTSCWFLCKFPYVNVNFFNSTFEHPYQKFRKMMLNFQRHNRRYHHHFYQRWLGHGHCLHYCKICEDMDSETRSTVSRDIQHIKMSFHQDIFYVPSDVDIPTECPHLCSLTCVTSKSIRSKTENIFSVKNKSAQIWHYYHNLSNYSKSLFKLCHIFHNDLNRNCLKILLKELQPVYSEFSIKGCVMSCLSTTQKKMVVDGQLPVSVESYVSGGYIISGMGLPKIDYFFPEPAPYEYAKYPNFFLSEFEAS